MLRPFNLCHKQEKIRISASQLCFHKQLHRSSATKPCPFILFLPSTIGPMRLTRFDRSPASLPLSSRLCSLHPNTRAGLCTSAVDLHDLIECICTKSLISTSEMLVAVFGIRGSPVADHQRSSLTLVHPLRALLCCLLSAVRFGHTGMNASSDVIRFP